jgi:uncharacterized protein
MKQEKDGVKKYFFDTYAIIEILSGSPFYAKFANEIPIITVFNLVELYYSAITNLDEQKAEEIYEKYSRCVARISDDILKEAMKFRMKNKKKDLSYADCIGYTYAMKNDLIFLTGDKEFQYMENVEFIK